MDLSRSNIKSVDSWDTPYTILLLVAINLVVTSHFNSAFLLCLLHIAT